MRTLAQPGPVHPSRIESRRGRGCFFEFTLQPGSTLNDALTRPLVEAGMRSAAIRFGAGAVAPFRYVVPARADDARHVAYFSAPRVPRGDTYIDRACATFGWSEGEPAVHIHGAWAEPDGVRRGGHMLPNDCVVRTGMAASAWGFRDVRIETKPDAETNFTLFQLTGDERGEGDHIVARIRPNQDITLAVEAVGRRHGMASGSVLGTLGSLIGARFADGRRVDDNATEVLVRGGLIRDGIAELDVIAVDMQGGVHEGLLLPGDNPVLITFDVVLGPV